jgi:hypothetical protein
MLDTRRHKLVTEGQGRQMTPAPKRRWLQFSLRTLFVAVTVFGIWLGREANIVRQRQLAIANMEELGGGPALGENMSQSDIAALGSPPRIPFWRRWMGDKPVAQLILPYEYTDKDETNRRVAALFPEVLMTHVWWSESHATAAPQPPAMPE